MKAPCIKSLAALLCLFVATAPVYVYADTQSDDQIKKQTVNLPDEVTLTATEIEDLLTGNTAIGRWSSTYSSHNYRQFFGADGSTIYAQEGARSALGRWRINSKANHYESWWERAGWGAGYSILLKEGVYYWVSSVGGIEPQAFEILPGSQLLFK